MCRNIRPLFNYDPPATKKEIHEASLQFIRKLSGFQKPSAANEKAFNHAIEHIEPVVHELLVSLKTNAEPHNREVEAQRAHERAVKRFGGKELLK
jgi:hypothetical protein